MGLTKRVSTTGEKNEQINRIKLLHFKQICQ